LPIHFRTPSYSLFAPPYVGFFNFFNQ